MIELYKTYMDDERENEIEILKDLENENYEEMFNEIYKELFQEN